MAQTAEERRERARLRMAARREADRAQGMSQREAQRARGGLPTARADQRDRAQARDAVRVDWRPFATITSASAACGIVWPIIEDRGRMVVRAARHTFGGIERADGDVLIARVPRSDTWTARAVTRDRDWRADSEATDVHACAHKGGHTATHSHGAPPVTRRISAAIDALCCVMFGHDPALAALDRSIIAECAAALTFGYSPVESWPIRAARLARERDEHVNGTFGWDTDERGRAVRVRLTDGCADCWHGQQATTWTASASASRSFAPMPVTRATRDANERIARDWHQVPFDARRERSEAQRDAQRASDDWARMIECAMRDARLAEYDARARA